MPFLALLPLLLLALLALWLLLWPLALWQRYRAGRARRRAIGWQVSLNAWSLLASTALFLAGAWLAGHWIAAAPAYAAAGVLAGLLTGVAGLALARRESTPLGLFHTPNRWLVLALTMLVAARLAWGLYRIGEAGIAGAPRQGLAGQGGMFAVGGVLLGYYLAYAWGLRRWLRRAQPRGRG